MDEELRQALERDEVIDITTTGRKTGSRRRVEIWFHYQDGRLFVTGTPGPRDWYANLVADPAFTFHLKQSRQRDIPAVATPILDEARRREVFDGMRALEPRMGHMVVEEWVARSPLVEVELRP